MNDAPRSPSWQADSGVTMFYTGTHHFTSKPWSKSFHAATGEPFSLWIDSHVCLRQNWALGQPRRKSRFFLHDIWSLGKFNPWLEPFPTLARPSIQSRLVSTYTLLLSSSPSGINPNTHPALELGLSHPTLSLSLSFP